MAFRYVVPKQAGLDEIRLASERSTFRLAKDATTYPLLLDGFQTPYEDAYVTLPLSAIHPKELIALPFLAELPGTAWVAITEADIDNYAGMYLEHNSSDALLLSSRLSPSLEDKDLAVVAPAPMATPWRVLLIGDEPGRHQLDQARQNGLGLVERHLGRRRGFHPRHEHRDDEALRRFLRVLRPALSVDRRRLGLPRHRP